MDSTWSLVKCGKSDEEGVDLAQGKRFGGSNDFGGKKSLQVWNILPHISGYFLSLFYLH